jgi:hypothetical protein
MVSDWLKQAGADGKEIIDAYKRSAPRAPAAKK